MKHIFSSLHSKCINSKDLENLNHKIAGLINIVLYQPFSFWATNQFPNHDTETY